MSRDLYEALFDRSAAEKISPDAAWMSLLSEVSADLRAWRADGLADAEFEEGLWVEADPARAAEVAPLRLAASDDDELDWPVTYRSGPWSVLLSLNASGQPYGILLEGPGLATLRIGAALIDLDVGEEQPLPDLDAPPAAISLIDEEGQQVVLQPVS